LFDCSEALKYAMLKYIAYVVGENSNNGEELRDDIFLKDVIPYRILPNPRQKKSRRCAAGLKL